MSNDLTRELPEEVQRWTAKRRAALVLSILRGETTAQEAARKHSITVAEVEDWKDRFLNGAENSLRTRPKDERKVGELVQLDIDIMKEAMKGHPFAPKTLDE